MLAAGASQGRCIEAIAERTGAQIGPEKLRNITTHLADTMEPQRQACQVQQLEAINKPLKSAVLMRIEQIAPIATYRCIT